MFIYRDLFPPDSHFIYIFCSHRDIQAYAGLYMFMQYYASLLLLFLIPCPERFSTALVVQGVFLFLNISALSEPCLEVASASKEV